MVMMMGNSSSTSDLRPFKEQKSQHQVIIMLGCHMGNVHGPGTLVPLVNRHLVVCFFAKQGLPQGLGPR
jgi:hypothetical protein